MRWINVDEQYLDYLRNYEHRIPKTNYGENKYKPFFGVLFEIDDLCYITQVSHARERHQKMTQQRDFYKIYDPQNINRLIAVINLNYMFPIPRQNISPFIKREIDLYRTFDSEIEKSKYINLLDIELSAINKMNISKKAQYIYRLKYDKPDNRVSKRCLDFKYLEDLARGYNK